MPALNNGRCWIALAACLWALGAEAFAGKRILGPAVAKGTVYTSSPAAQLAPAFAPAWSLVGYPPYGLGPYYPWIYRPRYVYPYRYYPLRFGYSYYSPYAYFRPRYGSWGHAGYGAEWLDYLPGDSPFALEPWDPLAPFLPEGHWPTPPLRPRPADDLAPADYGDYGGCFFW